MVYVREIGVQREVVGILVVSLILFLVSFWLRKRVLNISTLLNILSLSSIVACSSLFVLVSRLGIRLYNFDCFTRENVSVEGRVISLESNTNAVINPKGLDIGDMLVKVRGYSVLQVGETYIFKGNVVEPSVYPDFDYKRYLFNKGIYSILKVDMVEYVDSGWNIYKFRNVFEGSIKKNLPQPEASLLIGILLGSKQSFVKEFEESIRNSGVSHVISASGYNVSVLIIGINKIFGFVNRRLRSMISLLCIWVFTIFAGIPASLLRACVMSSVSLLTVLISRRGSIYVYLLICITLLLIFSPLIYLDIGFLLSVTSTLSLIFFLPCIEGRCKSNFIKSYILPTFSCTVFAIPISLYYFNTFSWVSLISNMLVLPILESSMVFGLLAIVFGNITKYVYIPVYLQLSLFKNIVNILGNIKGVSLEINPLVVYLVLVVLCIYLYPIYNLDENWYFRKAKKIFSK